MAFIANLKGEVALDGAARLSLFAELAKGQKLVLDKDATLSVMFIQSGKEFPLKGPGEYVIKESDIGVIKGAAPVARQTAWRTNAKVVAHVAQSSSASIRMRGIAPAEDKGAKLLYPTQGRVSSLQPTFRWNPADAKSPYEFTLVLSGDKALPVSKAKVTADSYALPIKLKPDTEYAWAVSASNSEIGTGSFRTLRADALRQVEMLKPTDKAGFTDRLMYALLLQDMGATQDALEMWSKLAKERTDLPELSALSKRR